MQYQIHETKLLSNTEYIDLATRDGKIYTQRYKKESEPNMFAMKEEKEGNHLSDWT